MIRLLIHALRDVGVDPGFFRLAESLTFRTLMGLATALALALVFGNRIISMLYRRRFRDTSGEHLSIGIHSKRGTPTGGGLLILLSTTVSAVLWADLTSPFIWPLLLGFIYLGLVGFVDDFLKVRFKSSLVGLSQLAKTFLQLLFAIPFAVYFVSSVCPLPEELRTVIQIPFYKYPLFDIGSIGFVLFTVFTLFAIINAVNITDGMDGLLGGTSILTTLVYLVFAYVIGNSELSSFLLFSYVPGTGEVAVFGAMLIGAVLGFLWFNAYPAQVFMGDTGSLAIGGVLGMMAFFHQTGDPLCIGRRRLRR